MKDSYVLSCLGIDGIAYSYKTAIAKVHSYFEQQIPIVGGDVFVLVNNSLEPTDDSWYCEQMPDEPYIDYVYRCSKVACDYINMYVSKNGNHLFFSIVV